MSNPAGKTQAEVLAEIGHEPLTCKTTMRSTQSFKDRMVRAADECGMTESEWLRSVAASAVELHEARESAIAAGLDFDDLEPDPLDEPVPTLEDADYEARVNAAAAEERARLAARVEPEAPHPVPERLDPRECPHHPRARAGPRCTDCGTLVGRVMTRSLGATGRFLGTVR